MQKLAYMIYHLFLTSYKNRQKRNVIPISYTGIYQEQEGEFQRQGKGGPSQYQLSRVYYSFFPSGLMWKQSKSLKASRFNIDYLIDFPIYSPLHTQLTRVTNAGVPK